MDIGDLLVSAFDRMGDLPFTLEDIARAALPTPAQGHLLADSERETLRAMAEVLLEDCPVTVPLSEVVDRFERFLIQGHSKRAWRCRMLLFLVEYAPIFAYGKRVRSLSIEGRRRYIREKLMKGGFVWSTCAKVRYLAYAGAYGHTAADAATGFVPFFDRNRAEASLRSKESSKEVRHEA